MCYELLSIKPGCLNAFVYYENCGPMCLQTCEFYAFPEPRVCGADCIDPGCYCPKGQVMIDGGLGNIYYFGNIS